VVHAPELFENSELLDLASDDPAYRQRSIDNLRRVVAVTETIADYFPLADSRLIVANVGGISTDRPYPIEKRTLLYRTIPAGVRGDRLRENRADSSEHGALPVAFRRPAASEYLHDAG
jgi:hypothetical protein